MDGLPSCRGAAVDVTSSKVSLTAPSPRTTGAGASSDKPTPGLAVTSIGLGIPITAISLGTTGGGTSGIVAMLIAWGGIAAVNLAHSRRR